MVAYRPSSVVHLARRCCRAYMFYSGEYLLQRKKPYSKHWTGRFGCQAKVSIVNTDVSSPSPISFFLHYVLKNGRMPSCLPSPTDVQTLSSASTGRHVHVHHMSVYAGR